MLFEMCEVVIIDSVFGRHEIIIRETFFIRGENNFTRAYVAPKLLLTFATSDAFLSRSLVLEYIQVCFLVRSF